MYTKVHGTDFHKIDKSIEKAMRGFPSQLVEYLKENFQKNIACFLGHPAKLEVDIVVDSSSIIADILSMVRKGKSKLHQLMNEPFMTFHAPTVLKAEIEERMYSISKEKKIDINALIDTWKKDFLPNINLREPKDLEARIKGLSTVGKRDKKDVPFVALYFELQSQGIVSRDKDIIEQPEVRSWKLGKLGNVVTLFKKGSLSFFIIGNVLPTIFLMLFQIGVAVLRVLVEIVEKFVMLLGGLVKGSIEAISKLPDWAKVLLGIAALIFVFYDKTRNAALEFFKEISKAIYQFAHKLYEDMRSLLTKLAPIVNIAIVSLAYLFEVLKETLVQVQDMNLDVDSKIM